VGTSVTIAGTNFMGATPVTFNGRAASFTVTSNTGNSDHVPAGAATGPLSVPHRGNGDSASSFAVAPTITKLYALERAGGDQRDDQRANFMGATAVTFNGIARPYSNL